MNTHKLFYIFSKYGYVTTKRNVATFSRTQYIKGEINAFIFAEKTSNDFLYYEQLMGFQLWKSFFHFQ